MSFRIFFVQESFWNIFNSNYKATPVIRKYAGQLLNFKNNIILAESNF